ncbi:MAG: DUF2079 domain-containing protein [Synechococcales bacterium]|nr:DUF2079 domain-containing protein [Synechococcales bacterium]
MEKFQNRKIAGMEKLQDEKLKNSGSIDRVPPWIFGISAIVFYLCSAYRHEAFASEAWDLGIFDQGIYLISQGLPPISTLLGFHIMGDHAALVFYPLAVLYRLIPTVHWLLGLQALAIAAGSYFTWRLATQSGLTGRWATVLAIVYLLYPIAFNANRADFHPETFAIPGFLAAVLSARLQKPLGFALSLLLVLTCRDALALNVAAMGLWLWWFEKRRNYGLATLGIGIAWFLIATQVIVPQASAGLVSVDRYLTRYNDLGGSYGEVAKTLILQPQILLGTLLTWKNLEYLLLLAAPIIWAIHPRHWSPLLAALPTIAMNLLSNNDGQRSLTDQYSVPIFPFLILVAIAGFPTRMAWFRTRKVLVIWALIGFLALGKWGLFWIYAKHTDTWSAARTAIGLIQDARPVLADSHLVPHVSHRVTIQRIEGNSPIEPYAHVLINAKRPWLNDRAGIAALLEKLQQNPTFRKTFDRDGILLYQKFD